MSHSGFCGLSREHGKPKSLGEGAITERYGWRQAKRRQDYAETHCAIAGLVSDRAAKRAARHRPSTELMPAFPTDC
jgi:hypothetical protein